MSRGIPAGWYTDPRQPGRQRYWDGTRWTHEVRGAELDGSIEDAPTRDAGSAASVSPANAPAPSAAERRPGPPPAEAADVEAVVTDPDDTRGTRPSRTSVVVLALIGVLAVGTVGAVLLLDVFGDDRAPAADGSTSEESEAEAGAEATGGEATPEPPPEQDLPAEEPSPGEDGEDDLLDIDGLDPGEAAYQLHDGDDSVLVQVTGGRGELPDGRAADLQHDLVLRADVTRDGRDELLAAFSIQDPSVPDGTVPAIGVVSADGDTPVAAPGLVVPELGTTSWSPPPSGFIDAISIVGGTLEVGLVVPPVGQDRLIDEPDRADPWVSNRQLELRLVHDGDGWQVSADGPVTRAAHVFAQERGVDLADVVCDGRADVRGYHPVCFATPEDAPNDQLIISLLIVSDTGGFRGVMGRDGPLSTATDVRWHLGSGEHLCRDIAEYAEESGTIEWELPMAAVSYWFDEGRPARMDAAQNGIPCETVFDDVAAFLDGNDGRIEERYLRRHTP